MSSSPKYCSDGLLDAKILNESTMYIVRLNRTLNSKDKHGLSICSSAVPVETLQEIKINTRLVSSHYSSERLPEIPCYTNREELNTESIFRDLFNKTGNDPNKMKMG